jgi:hypothetical protein
LSTVTTTTPGVAETAVSVSPAPNQQLIPLNDQTAVAQIHQYHVVSPKAVEAVLAKGDLTLLSEEDRVRHYMNVCESLGLNWMTKPLEYIEFTENGTKKLALYLTRGATDQIRMNLGVDVTITKRWEEDGVIWATAVATRGARTFEATAGVPVEIEDGDWVQSSNPNGKRYFKGNGQYKRLRGEKLINARLKLETKAYRRATLGIAGLGWLEAAGVAESTMERLTGNPDNDPYTDGPNHERAITVDGRAPNPVFAPEPTPRPRAQPSAPPAAPAPSVQSEGEAQRWSAAWKAAKQLGRKLKNIAPGEDKSAALRRLELEVSAVNHRGELEQMGYTNLPEIPDYPSIDVLTDIKSLLQEIELDTLATEPTGQNEPADDNAKEFSMLFGGPQ